jgi:hypothetical protein
MRLHQIKLVFDAEQDRLLMRVSTDDGKEVLLWLTRRCVKLLWPALLRVIQTAPEIAVQADSEARNALVGMQHEKAISQADFATPYKEDARERPLGVEPLLVSRIQTRQKTGGGCVLGLLPLKGKGINLTLDPNMLHSFCRLLQTSVGKAEWDFKLTLPQALAAETSGQGARTIN